ncbi:hypothetical protein PCE1_002929 [Barthelona sp. PCE]
MGRAFLIVSFLFILCFSCAYSWVDPVVDTGVYPHIKKVHLLFQNHLDIGFTAIPADVVTLYNEKLFPRAFRLIEELKGSENEFKYTTQPYLIKKFFDSDAVSAANKTIMKDHMQSGYIMMHAFPYNPEAEGSCEFMVDGVLSIVRDLANVLGIKNSGVFSLKDVPGVTAGAVPILNRHNVHSMHVGINKASSWPDTEKMFVWRPDGIDGELVVAYHHAGYGGPSALNSTDWTEALDFYFLGDNHGPPDSSELIRSYYHNLTRRYPNAVIKASSYDIFFEYAHMHKGQLPVVTKEIGDSWIHGYGSDPIRMAAHRAVCRRVEELRYFIPVSAYDDFILMMSRPMEHTWSIDNKVYMPGYEDVWLNADFTKHRADKDIQFVEGVWRSYRALVEDALSMLEPSNHLRVVLTRDLDEIVGFARLDLSQYISAADMNRGFSFHHFEDIRVGADGSIISATYKGNPIVSDSNRIGGVMYQTFNNSDYKRFLNQYINKYYNIPSQSWTRMDFGKWGFQNYHVERCEARFVRDNVYYAVSVESTLEIVVTGTLEECVDPNNGKPDSVIIYYTFSEDGKISVRADFFGKKTTRIPEALWMEFNPIVRTGAFIQKLGSRVSPSNNVKSAGQFLHGCDSFGFDGMKITPLDSALVAPESPHLLNFEDRIPDVENGGFHANMFNTAWATNFPQWSIDTEWSFRFNIDLE